MEPAPISNDDVAFNPIPRICMLGITGHGKSSLSNILCGTKSFKVSGGVKSETIQALQKEAFWFGGKDSEEKFFCLDTCGFGDSEGRDEMQQEDLIKILQTFCYVNTFLMVLNSAQPRFDQQIKEMFKKFKEVFKSGVFGHIVIVFTRWEYTKRAIAIRKKEGTSESLRESEINAYFKKELGYDTDNNLVPCVFVDTLSFADPELCEERELELLTEQFQKLKAYCVKGKQFLTMGLGEYLYLKKHLDQVRAEDKALFEKLAIQEKLLAELITRHPELGEKIKEMKKQEIEERLKMQRNLDNNLRGYFDNRIDETLKPSLLNDIWKINNEFNQRDTLRVLKSGLMKDLQKNLNEKLYPIIEERLKAFLEQEAYEFLKQSQADLEEVLVGFIIPIDIDIHKVVLQTFFGAGALTLAGYGLISALGIVGMIVIALIGVAGAVSSTLWSREDAVAELTREALDKIATNEIRQKLIDISTEALDKVMLKIISLKKDALIEQFSQENKFA